MPLYFTITGRARKPRFTAAGPCGFPDKKIAFLLPRSLTRVPPSPMQASEVSAEDRVEETGSGNPSQAWILRWVHMGASPGRGGGNFHNLMDKQSIDKQSI